MSARPIILVEDNEQLRRLYVDVLEAAGFNVVAVENGEKAIALLHKVPNPALIILDIMMPRMNGIETCARIRKMQGRDTCPIIFLTALDRPETLLECLQAGGDDYMMKSAPVAEILERAQYWARKGDLEDAAARRARAIKELESIVEAQAAGDFSAMNVEISSEQANMDLLAGFLLSQAADLGEDDDLLFRFGYLVGLVEGCFPTSEGHRTGSKRFLRNLIFKTNFVARHEVDALLENYERVILQSRFRLGWVRGRDAAADVEKPEPGRLSARLLGD